MCLSAARFAIQTMFSGKLMSPATVNVMILRRHGYWLKCCCTDLSIVSRRKPTIYFTPRRCVNVTASLGSSRNYYDILGVPRDASQKQIKAAYYKLAMIHHPDKNQGIHTKQFRDIKEAYDILSNESSRKNYNMGSSNNSYNNNTSNNWTDNSSYGRYNTNQEYTYNDKYWSRTEYNHQRTKRSRGFDQHKPFNVFINVISVPQNIIKTQIDIMLLSFIKNRKLKWILLQLFQYIWTWGLNSLNYNVLISSSTPHGNPLVEFMKNLLETHTVRIELTEIEAIKGKAVRVKVNENEKVLVVNIPRGVQKGQSFYLFYLIDDNDNMKFKG